MNSDLNAYSLLVLGYRDYIAARYLLNNNFTIQGLTLSSTAVEKYIKVLLVANGKSKREINVHLHKLDQLKKALSECYFDITEKIDERFLNVLGKVYEIRYYDDIKSPVTIGFFIDQFIGELDFVINMFETLVITDIKDGKGNVLKTPYHHAVESKDKNLFENNYLFSGITKKEHMEKLDNGFGMYIHPNSLAHGEIAITGKGIINKYDGLIWEIKVNFEKPSDVE